MLPSSLPKDIFDKLKAQTSQMSEKLDEIEKLHILKVLEETNENKTRTAEILGIGLTTLYRKLKEYGID
jgi:two-component system, NtrC family, response regulator